MSSPLPGHWVFGIVRELMALVNNLHVVSGTGFGMDSQGFGASVALSFSKEEFTRHKWCSMAWRLPAAAWPGAD